MTRLQPSVATHTPGPWITGEADEFGDHNITPNGEIAAVAAVVSNMRAPSEVAANSKLIAAAPDLLTTLNDLHDYVGRMHVAVHDQRLQNLLIAAAYEISKARGEL